MKKTQRGSRSPARSAAKKQGKTHTQASKTKAAPARNAVARIPVRGARKPGVKNRAPAELSPPAPRRDLTEVRELAIAAMDAALDKKALGPVLIDVSAMASYTDFIGIVSGRSDRQVDAIAESIRQAMKARGRHVLGQEGTGSGRWTLLDFGAFVVHIFYHPVREFYDLESLWIDAPRVKLDVPAEASLAQPDALYGAL